MSVQTVLAAVPVRDLSAASEFYERLLGRPFDLSPMPSLVQWDFLPSGGLQVVELPEQAGTGMVTLLLDDFDADLETLTDRGIELGEVVAGVVSRLTTTTDPSGNTVTLAGVAGA